MSKLFPLTDLPSGDWAVSWPDFNNIKKIDSKLKLLDIVFKEIKCMETGVGVKLNNEETEVLWIDLNTWAQDRSGLYSEYLQDMYIICGMVFRKQDDAIKFQEWLEKKYIWKVLQA